MLRSLMILAAVLALAACQPAAEAPAPAPPAPAEGPAAAAFQPGLELEIEDNVARLNDWIDPAKASFSIVCTLDSPVITLQADRKQFAQDLKAETGALVVSGASFPDTALIQEGPDAIVALAVDITPDLLKALSTATTARLAVNDSFAETGVDAGDTFEKLAAKCSELSKVKIAP